MAIERPSASVTVPNSLADALSRCRHDVVILSAFETWDSPVYAGESIFLAKFLRNENIDCDYLHTTSERQYEEKFSAEIEAVINLVLAILNSEALPAVVRSLATIIHRIGVPELRIQFIYRKSAEGDELTCLRAEGSADSVIQALREVANNIHSRRDEK